MTTFRSVCQSLSTRSTNKWNVSMSTTTPLTRSNSIKSSPAPRSWSRTSLLQQLQASHHICVCRRGRHHQHRGHVSTEEGQLEEGKTERKARPSGCAPRKKKAFSRISSRSCTTAFVQWPYSACNLQRYIAYLALTMKAVTATDAKDVGFLASTTMRRHRTPRSLIPTWTSFEKFT